MFHDYFNTRIHNEEVEVSGMSRLQEVLNREPGGDDNVGRCTIEKLTQMKPTKDKQYLLVISDGTADLGGPIATNTIIEMAKAKNVEIRFILFTEDMDEYTIPHDWFFYFLKR
jgi:uncharacterized protein with von Willebrand factor type A (vWA) domain